MFKTYSSSSSLVITSRWFATSRLVAPVSVRLVYSSKATLNDMGKDTPWIHRVTLTKQIKTIMCIYYAIYGSHKLHQNKEVHAVHRKISMSLYEYYGRSVTNTRKSSVGVNAIITFWHFSQFCSFFNSLKPGNSYITLFQVRACRFFGAKFSSEPACGQYASNLHGNRKYLWFATQEKSTSSFSNALQWRNMSVWRLKSTMKSTVCSTQLTQADNNGTSSFNLLLRSLLTFHHRHKNSAYNTVLSGRSLKW